MVRKLKEDTDATFEDMKKEFGDKVLEIVRGLTDLPEFEGLPVAERKRRQLERIRMEGRAVRRIKLADQISAVEIDGSNELLGISHKRQYIEGAKRIAEECKGISPFLDQKFSEAYAHAMRILGQNKHGL